MYRKTRDMLIVLALTMSMLLVGIGPAQASDDDGGLLGLGGLLGGLLGGRDGDDGEDGYDSDDDDDDDDGNNCLLGILCIFNS